VLAIFIGGLGLGSLVLGRRSDRVKNPLISTTATSSMVIAASAAVSPVLLALARTLYIASGGTPALGNHGRNGGAAVLAALVLAVPTLAMAALLSAAARAIESDATSGGARLAVLYGVTTLGAVAGAMVSTFFLLEVFGTRRTILVAALLNVLVALAARSVSAQGRRCAGARGGRRGTGRGTDRCGNRLGARRGERCGNADRRGRPRAAAVRARSVGGRPASTFS